MGEPQGIYVIVQDKYNTRIDNVSVSGGGGWCITDGGRCWYYTRSGWFTVSVSRYGYISRSQSVFVEGEHFEDVNFTLSTEYEMHASIEGVVHDENGDPLSNIMVWGTGILGNTKYYGCNTQSDGSYSLPINSLGDYIIYCGKNNYDIINGGTYYQPAAIPTYTAIFNFTGDNVAVRNGNDTDSIIGVANRSFMIKDDLSTSYYYVADEGDTDTVYAKARKWTGGHLDTYSTDTEWELSRDGYGGTQYD